jgi:cytochrome c-type biogenesis protein
VVSGAVLIAMGVLLYSNELTRLNSEALQAMDDLGINFFNEI